MRRLERQPGGGAVTFGPTSGAISGVVGVIFGVGVGVFTLSDGLAASDLPYVFGGLAFALLAWAILLRPRVRLHAGDLELRNGFSQFRIPYAAITEVTVRSYTIVHTGDRRYNGLGVGRTRRAMTGRRKDELTRARPDMTSGRSLEGANEADLLEATLDERVRAARGAEPGKVTRQWAVPEMAALLVLLIAFLVSVIAG